MQKNPRPNLIGLRPLAISLVSAAVLLSGCQQKGGFTPPPALVEAKSAVERPWAVTFQTTGTVEANNKVDLNSETPGIINRILVREGDYVKRGQVLMRLKADKAAAQIQQSAAGIEVSKDSITMEDAQVQQTQANLNAAKVRLDNAASEYRRFQKLFTEQFISEQELDQKHLAFDTATADYQAAQELLVAARARRKQAQSNLVQASSNYRYTQAVANENLIQAPFSGLIGQKYVDLGDYVAPAEKLITLVDPSVYRIMFTIPERYLGDIKQGLPVKVTFEGLRDRTFGASVDFVDPVVDLENRTVAVKAVMSDAQRQLRHGLFGSVFLTLRTIPDAVVIPEEAVVPQGDKTLVYVIKNGKAQLREIVVGYRDAGLVKVDSGLRPNERVIVSGLQKVHDGSDVVENTRSGAPGGMQGKASEVARTKIVEKTETREKH